MAFGYVKGTISGSLVGVDGVTSYIQTVGSFMQNTLGWQLVEDRTAVAGATKQFVLKSNGEDSTASTFYFALTSGTNNAGVQAATAWDTGTHAVAASGAISPSASTTVTMNMNNKTSFNYWVSGDKDSVVLVTKTNGAYDMTYFGRIRQITSAAQDTFPIYVVGNSNALVDVLGGSNIYTFLSATTALATAGNSDFDSLFTSPLGTDEAPQNIFGAMEGYVCLPAVAGISTTTQRSVRGFSINFWTTVGPNGNNLSSLSQEDVLDPGTGRTYQVFFDSANSTTAAVIRRS